ncbi:MAG TPA: MFS transporter [Gaiellaceae bacterium]|jgi:MFS family permease
MEAAAWRGREGVAYAALLMLGALDAAGYSLIAPVLPSISQRTGAGPALVGLLVASFPAAMIVGFALAGRGVRSGRTTPMLRLSLALILIGCVGFVLGGSLGVYAAARVVMGLGSGGLWIGITFATLERWPGQEYVCMSRVFAAYSAGGLVGPAIGALGGVRLPFAVYGVLVALGFAVVYVLGASPEPRVFASDRAALRLRGFWLAAAGILFAVLGLGIVEGVLPLHLSERLSQGEIGGLYVGMSLVVSASAAVAGALRPRPILLGATLLVVVGLALAGATNAIPIWLLALALAGCGIGLANTGSLGVLVETVKSERIVTAMVVWSQIGIVGYLLGPVAGGAVTQSLGYGVLGLVPASAAAVLLAVFVSARRAASA